MKTARAKTAWLAESGVRLDAAYHLSEGRLAKHIIESSKTDTISLRQATERIFMGFRFKRIYVANSQLGYPYLTASAMSKTLPISDTFLSKKLTNNYDSLKIEIGWILLSRSGSAALGTTALATKDFEGQIGTDDLIRIIPNQSKLPTGYLYAFLASKYGLALLKQGTYGSAILHIEPHHIADLPIPLLTELEQQHIHVQVEEASRLRVEANRLLGEAVHIMESSLPSLNFSNFYKAKLNDINSGNIRLDATSYLRSISAFYQQTSKFYKNVTINELSGQVFTPGIFKRLRVQNPSNGVPFLSGSDLLQVNPRFYSFLSLRMPNLSQYLLREGWLCLQDSGTIGYASLIPKNLDGVSATNNLVRILPKNESNFYLFPFFKTKQGQFILKSLAYGSVQQHIDTNQVKNVLVPIIPQKDEIAHRVKLYLQKWGESNQLENAAIMQIEQSIESLPH